MKSATYRLPFPVSVNDMYANASGNSRGRGRFKTPDYKSWLLESSIALNAQEVTEFRSRVEISIDLDDRRRGDADNRTKPVLDFLVKQGVLLDDSKPYVKRTSIGWEKCDGCQVHIREVGE